MFVCVCASQYQAAEMEDVQHFESDTRQMWQEHVDELLPSVCVCVCVS